MAVYKVNESKKSFESSCNLKEMAVPSSDYKNQAVGWVAYEVYLQNPQITRTNDSPGITLQKDHSNLGVACEIHITPQDNQRVRVICKQDSGYDNYLDVNSAVNYILLL